MIFKGKSLTLMLVMLAMMTFSSCTCENPLSGLEWGSGIVSGVVNARHPDQNGANAVQGMPDVIITVEDSNESTITDKDGKYSLKIDFRVGRTANSKKVKLNAMRSDIEDELSSDDILLVDGQTTIALPMVWEHKH